MLPVGLLDMTGDGRAVKSVVLPGQNPLAVMLPKERSQMDGSKPALPRHEAPSSAMASLVSHKACFKLGMGEAFTAARLA